MDTHTISGGGGTDIHVVEAGPRAATPVVFVHGYSQSHRSWRAQFESPLAEEFRLIAPDNRGHGQSGTPKTGYDDGTLWADDLRAVIEQLELDDAVLVAWSYAGLIVLDYLAVHGTDRISGVQFVDAISKIGTEAATALLDAGYIDLLSGLCSTDAETSIEALSAFVERCVHGDRSVEDFYTTLGYSAVVPPFVREALRDRVVVHDDLVGDLDVPVMVVYGEADRIVRPEAARTIAAFAGTDRVSAYPDTGHSPFAERPERFNTELRSFLHAVRS